MMLRHQVQPGNEQTATTKGEKEIMCLGSSHVVFWYFHFFFPIKTTPKKKKKSIFSVDAPQVKTFFWCNNRQKHVTAEPRVILSNKSQ